jgi:hypothetical protein
MDLSSVLDLLGDGRRDEPAVVVRLCLLAADEASGQPKRVSSFLRKISMPPVLASRHVKIALEVQGERRVFKPVDVTWDEAHRVCIIEVAWLVADERIAEEIEEAEPWPVG